MREAEYKTDSVADSYRRMDTGILAYLGDAVYSAFIRGMLVAQGLAKLDKLHRATVRFVRAEAQAWALAALKDELTEEEADLVRRARNKRVSSQPQHVDPVVYKQATAFEALVGYLHLSGRTDRLSDLLRKAFQAIESADAASDRIKRKGAGQ